MKPLISIIIPCYNSERHIEECINSIAKQVDQDVEIIIINDGSTDKSEEIIKKCLLKFPKIRINYHKQDNSGAAHSRNQGILFSQGNYIGFLDSDDIWLNDTWKILKPILENEDNDLIQFDAYRFDKIENLKKGNRFFETYLKKCENKTHKEKLKIVFSAAKWYSWPRIYRKKILENASFLTSCRLGEDIPFTVQAYLNSENIRNLNIPIYGYRYNPESITNNHKKTDLYDYEKILLKLQDLSGNETDNNKKYLLNLASVRTWYTLKYYNFYYKDQKISNILNKTKKNLNKYNYNQDLSKKFIILFKYNLISYSYFYMNAIISKLK